MWEIICERFAKKFFALDTIIRARSLVHLLSHVNKSIGWSVNYHHSGLVDKEQQQQQQGRNKRTGVSLEGSSGLSAPPPVHALLFTCSRSCAATQEIGVHYQNLLVEWS